MPQSHGSLHFFASFRVITRPRVLERLSDLSHRAATRKVRSSATHWRRILAFSVGACVVPATAVAQSHSADDVSGAVLYQKLCAKCHGPAGIPPDDVAELLRPVPSDLTLLPYRYGSTLEAITTSIRIGRGDGMFRFDNRLSDEQIRQVADFVSKTFAGNPSGAH
ncbi:MAG: cytochrome c [Bdellovibrionales bacterium]|nr:cytochrome c [Bdellovibrionales bacterium]